MNTRNWSDEVLMAYADGVLPEPEAAAVRAAALAQPEVAARIELFRASRQVLRGTFEPLLREPVPQRLQDAVQRLDHERKMQHKPFRIGVVFAIAASLMVVAALAWRFGPTGGGGAPEPLAAAAAVPDGVAQLLNRLPSGEPAGASVAGRQVQVLPLASYDDRGVLCRDFELSQSERKAERALACLEDGVWRVRALARPGMQPPAGNVYLPASGDGDLAATLGLKQPLSPQEERRLLDNRRN